MILYSVICYPLKILCPAVILLFKFSICCSCWFHVFTFFVHDVTACYCFEDSLYWSFRKVIICDSLEAFVSHRLLYTVFTIEFIKGHDGKESVFERIMGAKTCRHIYGNVKRCKICLIKIRISGRALFIFSRIQDLSYDNFYHIDYLTQNGHMS